MRALQDLEQHGGSTAFNCHWFHSLHVLRCGHPQIQLHHAPLNVGQVAAKTQNLTLHSVQNSNFEMTHWCLWFSYRLAPPIVGFRKRSLKQPTSTHVLNMGVSYSRYSSDGMKNLPNQPSISNFSMSAYLNNQIQCISNHTLVNEMKRNDGHLIQPSLLSHATPEELYISFPSRPVQSWAFSTP